MVMFSIYKFLVVHNRRLNVHMGGEINSPPNALFTFKFFLKKKKELDIKENKMAM